MSKYIVIEMQTNADGTVGNLVSAYDERNAAESAYHSVLASAAISSLPCHAAVLMTNEGFQLMSQCYKHPVPEPEPTPEPEPETVDGEGA